MYNTVSPELAGMGIHAYMHTVQFVLNATLPDPMKESLAPVIKSEVTA